MVAAAAIPPAELVIPRSTAYARRTSAGPSVSARRGRSSQPASVWLQSDSASGRSPSGSGRYLEDQAVPPSLRQRDVARDHAGAITRALGRAAPTEREAAGRALPHARADGAPADGMSAESWPWIERNLDVGVLGERLDATEDDSGLRIRGQGERLAALDRCRRRDPPAAPDQRAVLVVAAPNVSRLPGGDGVQSAAADQRCEDRVAVPAGHAHERDVAVRTDHGAALPIGDEGVLAQRLRREPLSGRRDMTRHAEPRARDRNVHTADRLRGGAAHEPRTGVGPGATGI